MIANRLSQIADRMAERFAIGDLLFCQDGGILVDPPSSSTFGWDYGGQARGNMGRDGGIGIRDGLKIRWT